MLSTAKGRRAALGSMLAAGVGLLGFSLHGLVSLDGQLSAATRTPPPRSVTVSDDGTADRHPGDCPWRERLRRERAADTAA